MMINLPSFNYSISALLAASVLSTGITTKSLAQKNHPDSSHYLSQPLVKDIYTADPSAHVFNGKIYIYPSHDVDAGIPENDNGDHFDMRDYHILSMTSVPGKVTDHGVALTVKDVPWAGRQLWAPDAAYKRHLLFILPR